VNYLDLVNRTKLESGRSGGNLATVVGAVGDDLRICNWVSTAWEKIQRRTEHWRWMRKRVLMSITAARMDHAPALIAQMLVQPGNTLALTDFRGFRNVSDDYTVSALLPAVPANEWRLTWLPYDVFRDRFIVGTHVSASPTFWAVSPDNLLLLGPTPNAIHHVRFDYRTKALPLALDADIPGMPDDYHMVIAWEALKNLAAFDAAPEVYSRARDECDQLYDDLWTDQGPKMTIGARPLA